MERLMPEIAISGCELYYELIDLTPPWVVEPETLIFYHGLGSTCDIWAGWLPALVDHFRVLRFDMRGHGRSRLTEPKALVTLDILTDDLFAVADAAGLKRFHLVGRSIGGTIGLNSAVRHRERLLSLTVSNGAHVGSSIESVQNWRQIIEASGMTGWSKYMMQQRFFDDAVSEDMWRWYEREQANVSPDFLLAALAALVNADLVSKLETLDLPVLLMHADSSPFISINVMADLKTRLSDCRLQVFAHARHGLPFSHARDCAETLRRFLNLSR
jgi:pimeloyl-ACP methyl ester carboxylesterase